MTLTATQIRCLIAILTLTRMNEEVASKNIAKLLGVTRPSVHKTLDILVAKGLLEKEHCGAARLSAQGEVLAVQLEERRDRLFLLFSQRYGLSLDESSIAATVLMSELKEESLKKLEKGI